MALDSKIISGKYGCAKISATVDGSSIESGASTIYEVTAWQYSEQMDDQSYASCETNGQKGRVDGSYDITGTVSVIVNADQPFRGGIAVGDDIILYLYHRKPASGVTGIYDRIPAKLLGISGGLDIEQGGPVRFELSFGLNITVDEPSVLFDQSAPALA